MADVFYETETGPTMAALYDKLERRVAERCPGHLKAFRAEALASLAQLMAACEEREEQQERGREALKSSGQRGKPVRNAAKRLGKSRTEARKLGAMIAHYRALTLQEEQAAQAGQAGLAEGERDTKADGKERPPFDARPPGLLSGPLLAGAGGEGEKEEMADALLAAFAGLKMKAPAAGEGQEGAGPEPSPSETTAALLSSNSSSVSSSSSSSLSGAALGWGRGMNCV